MMARPRVGVAARHYLSDLQPYTALCSAVLAVVGVASVASAPVLLERDGAATAASELPAPASRLLGLSVGQSLDTGIGHLNATFLSLALPLVLIALGIVGASRALAGAAGSGELELLVSNPVTRSQLLVERLLAVSAAQVQVAAPAVLLVAVGSQLGQIDVGALTVLGAGIKAMVLATFISSIAMIASAASSGVLMPAAVGALATAASFGAVAFDFGSLSPVGLALGEAPAAGGAWLGTLIALVAVGVIAALATVVFDRRDIC
ncbi:MAG: hypothetical protein KDB16_01990 [Acidimicrobiales bacterium]|nr:hypothetical protein [Acidimicrobiales bacterium]